MYVDFNTLSNNSKLWIYQTDSPFSSEELSFIKNYLVSFCDSWDSHGAALKASFNIIENRFIIISVDCDYNNASGCSIDKSVRAIQEIQDKLGRNLLDKSQVSFQDQNDIQAVSFNEIKEAIHKGIIADNTLIYNTSITSMEEFNKQWPSPAKDTWLKRFFQS